MAGTDSSLNCLSWKGYDEKSHCSRADALVGIAVPQLHFPKSMYSGWEPPSPRFAECEAVDILLRECEAFSRMRYADADFINFQLEDFTVYKDGSVRNLRDGMVTLNEVATKQGSTTYFFDGILKTEDPEGVMIYVQNVPFRLVSIGGYEDIEQHTVGSDIWIQSTYCQTKGNIWYRLGKPDSDYAQYHHLFVWVANLAKHFVDYLREHQAVTLNNFKYKFSSWIKKQHGCNPYFARWLSEYGRSDFRQAVIAHADFLQKQALNLEATYKSHPIWSEIGVSATPIVKEQPQRTEKTIVTPYVFECFKEMEWADHLQVVEPGHQVLAHHRCRLEKMHFIQPPKRKVPSAANPTDGSNSTLILNGKSTISLGDVIATWKDQVTPWKGTDDHWYAFVQGIHPRNNRPTRLSLIWLYRPSDTVCANLSYPHMNELFLSDHCNCGDSIVDTSQVISRVNVTFFSSQAEGDAEFFIRQTYSSGDETFTSLKEDDFCCRCRRLPQKRPKYKPGDTVLIECINEKAILEPAEIMEYRDHNEVKIREFLRRGRDFNDSRCRPNELVYTERYRTIHIDQICRHCHVRSYTQEDVENKAIRAPYNRDGNGDAFYVVVREVRSEKGSLLEPVRNVTFKPGINLRSNHFPKLRALNIFSGGGNFDRGLEEGSVSAIQNEWAVELELAPMLTYRANHDNPEWLKLYRGSVNDYLAQSIRGEGGEIVAKLGEPGFISAGSPCQGYSLINSLKDGEVSLRNSSMIASVASYIDFFRPMYAVLENVPAMANKSHKRNPLSQLLCAFAGMGYQIRILNLDAWSFGAAQSRSRLFVVIAAPGLQLPSHPPLTHSHPETTKQRSLGEAPNGLPFGNRRWNTPVFEFVTAIEATKDLPKINAARVMSISRPDHRPSRLGPSITQNLISSIPKAPRRAGLLGARQRGWLSEQLINTIPPKKRKSATVWSRVHPHLLIPTITTSVSPACMFTGRWLHWEEDRLLTVMEARRAQGYPDDEVLIGRPSQQWKIAGNSVARQVALALGLVIREACIQNEEAQDASHSAETVYTTEEGRIAHVPECELVGKMSSANPLAKFRDHNPFSVEPGGVKLYPSAPLRSRPSGNQVVVSNIEGKLHANATSLPEVVIIGSMSQILPAHGKQENIIPKKRVRGSNPAEVTLSKVFCRKKTEYFRNGESSEDPIILDSD